ncbi:hypothetical protein JHD50_11360 [Sulfurimonas sp. MAG313]|nr:hypothetical protein [Sulfurimonas sp. MAG313]MDF1881886.1 hypothetical protein [Sulfurimonas sp. MAG313]
MKTNILILALMSSLIQANTAEVTPTVKGTPAVNTKAMHMRTISLVTKSTDTSWVDQKIEEIKPQRHGLNTSTLTSIKSPFIVIRPKTKEGAKKVVSSVKSISTDSQSLVPSKRDMSKEPLTLQIVLNTSALINGKWLKENDTFRGYKLAQIQGSYVVLERKNKKIKLFIAQKSKNINITTK